MRNRVIAAALAAAIALSALGAWAAPKRSDAAAIVGSWKSVEGRYADGGVEKDIAMTIVYTASTMSDPMGKNGEVLPYSMDERAKTIAVRTPAVEMRIAYRFEDPSTLVLTELTVVKAGKTTSIIGPGQSAMFTSLVLKKQP